MSAFLSMILYVKSLQYSPGLQFELNFSLTHKKIWTFSIYLEYYMN